MDNYSGSIFTNCEFVFYDFSIYILLLVDDWDQFLISCEFVFMKVDSLGSSSCGIFLELLLSTYKVLEFIALTMQSLHLFSIDSKLV